MHSIYVGETEIRLHGNIGHFVTEDRFGPFLNARLATGVFDLSFEAENVSVGGVSQHFEYQRQDLHFVAPSTLNATAYFDGGLAAFLAALELALYVAVSASDGLLVHASVGTVGTGAWLMPGPSGTGKSTAALGGFERVLSDERVLLLKGEHGFKAWGTPFWSDGRQMPLDAGSAQLVGIACLRKAETPMVEIMGRAEMLTWLMGSIVAYGNHAARVSDIFDFVADVIQSVDCVKLSFPREGKWAPLMLNPIGLAS